MGESLAERISDGGDEALKRLLQIAESGTSQSRSRLKMTRDGLSDRKLGDELIIDIAHYKQIPGCKHLLCFVYDPDHRLRNPSVIEKDLSKPTDELDVLVLIRPKY
jgi:hypothetical protein